MTDKRSVTARLNPTRKAKLEAMAGVYYQGAQADVIRRWIDEQFSIIFGDLDPTALLDGRVDETDARQIMKDVESDAGERIDDAGIDDGLRMDEDEQVAAVAQDGGALTHQPERFETMLGPQELQQSGPALEWDELREIVSDDGHWSETLEIHPDRVQPGTLKSNHKITSRILAAMARSEANGGVVRGEVVEELVTDYTFHLHNRADDDEGQRYIKQTYEPLVRKHLWVNGDATTDKLFTDRQKQIDAFEATIERPFGGFELDTETVLDPERWFDTVEAQTFDADEWHSDIAAWVERVASLQHVALELQDEDAIGKEELAVDVPDQYHDTTHWLVSAVGDLLQRFEDALKSKIRNGVLEHRVSDTVEDLIRERLE